MREFGQRAGRFSAWYRERFRSSGGAVKFLLIIIPLAILLCLCAVPLSLFTTPSNPTPEPEAIANDRSDGVNLDEVVGQATERAATNTPQPSRTPTEQPPTEISEPTDTPAPTATPDIAIEEELVGRVSYIIDGDTIEVNIDGEFYSVRYIGVDSPERGDPNYEQAAEANRQLVEGKTVTLVKDESERDRFGRLLRYVYLEDGTFVNGELVRIGVAESVAYPPDTSQQSLLDQYQSEAQAAGLGLWAFTAASQPSQSPTQVPAPTQAAIEATPTPIPTQAAESTQAPEPTQAPPTEPPLAVPGQVIIVGVNKRAEYVDLQNIGGSPVDLGGWTLVSEKGNQQCPLGGVIQAGAFLRVWALAADAGQGGFNCGKGSNIWNNSEPDPAVLYNSSGQEVSRYP